jgi:NAD(P)-dependent dehydrogenase (short-subunit alcohol dehydrogenase family)
MDLSGKTCMITGANSGLGLAITKQFARLGAEVIMVCRDQSKGEAAVADVRKDAPEAPVELLMCDFASFDSVKSFIKNFIIGHRKINVLINNAAVMTRQRTVTVDGYELMFQVNYLVPFILTTSLLYTLKQSSPSQVINISVPSPRVRLNFDDLQSSEDYDYLTCFPRTKLCLLLFGIELSRRNKGTGMTVTIGDPGLFKSQLNRELPGLINWIWGLFSATADRAAENITFLATSDDVLSKSGSVYVKRNEKSRIPYWDDRVVAERLWSITESLTADITR